MPHLRPGFFVKFRGPKALGNRRQHRHEPAPLGFGICCSIMKKLSLALALAATCVLLAQDKVDEATTARIRSEELEHSQIMHTIHMLADRYGPRVTGTPNHEAAVDWVIAETTRWGMKNAHKEKWDFNRAGWLNERAWGFINAPVHENLKFEVLG